jgi:tetratricopeptide (TPR) repeat protein
MSRQGAIMIDEVKPAKGYYSILQFVPDLERTEGANIGVVLFCPEKRFLRAQTATGNDRVRRFFGPEEGLDLDRINAYKTAFEERVAAEASRISTPGEFKQFVDTRANQLLLTEPRPIKVFDAEAELASLFDTLVDGKAHPYDLSRERSEQTVRAEPDPIAKEAFERGIEFFNDGDRAAAEGEFRRAVALEPSYMGVLNNSVIQSFGDEGDWQRSITVLRFVLSIDPSYAPARENLAIALLNYGYDEAKSGNFPLATDIYTAAAAVESSPETALQIKINMASAFTALGERAGADGQTEAAWQCMLRACSFYPSATTRHNLGLAYTYHAFSSWNAGDFNSAIEFFLRAQDVGFVNGEVLKGYAGALASAGRVAEAEKAYERALVLAPEDGTTIGSLPMIGKGVEAQAMAREFRTNGHLEEFGRVLPGRQKYATPVLDIASPVYQVAA